MFQRKSIWLTGENKKTPDLLKSVHKGYWRTEDKQIYPTFEKYVAKALEYVSTEFRFCCYEYKNHYAIKLKRKKEKNQEKKEIKISVALGKRERKKAEALVQQGLHRSVEDLVRTATLRLVKEEYPKVVLDKKTKNQINEAIGS